MRLAGQCRGAERQGGDHAGSTAHLPEFIGYSINRWRFVRSAESNGWISIADLSEEKKRALDERIDREHRERDDV
jgi:hypothetical protein